MRKLFFLIHFYLIFFVALTEFDFNDSKLSLKKDKMAILDKPDVKQFLKMLKQSRRCFQGVII